MTTRSNTHTAWRRRGTAVVAGMAALSVATLGFASAVGAAGVAGVARTTQSLEKPLGASPSDSFAGYQSTPNGGLASASVTFTVPKITCTKSEEAAGAEVWSGAFTSSLQAYALVAAQCHDSGPTYAWQFQTLAGQFNEPGAMAGDVVVASLFQSSTSTFAELHDLTAGVNWGADIAENQGDTVVNLGNVSETGSGVPVPTFTKVPFTNATVNGDYLGFEGPVEFNTLNGGDLLIKTGHLATSGTGSAFSTQFKKSS